MTSPNAVLPTFSPVPEKRPRRVGVESSSPSPTPVSPEGAAGREELDAPIGGTGRPVDDGNVARHLTDLFFPTKEEQPVTKITYSNRVFHLSRDGLRPICGGDYSGAGTDRYRPLPASDTRATLCTFCQKLTARSGYRTTDQWVYFARRRIDGAVKIGVARDVDRRLGGLAIGAGPVDLLVKVAGDFGLERSLHKRLSELKLHGEWFRPEPPLPELIALLKDGR